ncbi:MAG: SufD family Fe-S cluster assembly protein, partial [Gemmatimonadales bacterium]
HNLHVRLNDENIETLMYGLYLTRGEQTSDTHTAIYHDQPNCRSWEVYKGILDGRSRAVFNGKVFVKPEAQKTDAKQTNRNLLLTDDARVHTKPQLEIFADDVKCTHGATVGRLDEVARFYARSRGIPAAAADRLLRYAFAADVVDEVALAPVREELDRLVRERLGGL